MFLSCGTYKEKARELTMYNENKPKNLMTKLRLPSERKEEFYVICKVIQTFC